MYQQLIHYLLTGVGDQTALHEGQVLESRQRHEVRY